MSITLSPHRLHYPDTLTEGTKAYIAADTVTDLHGGTLPGNTLVRLRADVQDGTHHAKFTILTGKHAGTDRHILTRYLRIPVPAPHIIHRATA